MLEAHVPFVNRLHAGATRESDQAHRERQGKGAEAQRGRGLSTALVLEPAEHGTSFSRARVQAQALSGERSMDRLFSCYASPQIMFTGLVELKGTLARRARRGPGYRLSVAGALGALTLGESISVSGACLTVVSSDDHGFEADVSLETAERTTLGALPIGAPVNLERALKLGDRLGGHLVSGHVDAVAELRSITPAGDAQRLSVRFPRELSRFIAAKGSITLDGVSLTVNAVTESELSVMVIPHTLAVTTLGELKPGAPINLEIDTLARYAVRFLEVSAGDPEASLKDALRKAGYESAGGT